MAASKCLQGEREDRLKICPAGHGGIVTGNSHILKQQTGFKEKTFQALNRLPRESMQPHPWKRSRMRVEKALKNLVSRFPEQQAQISRSHLHSKLLSEPMNPSAFQLEDSSLQKYRRCFIFQRGKVL